MHEEARPAFTKYFSVPNEQLQGHSAKTKYEKYGDYKKAKDQKALCFMYGMAYADTMLTRLEQEDPEYFETSSKSKPELGT
jgi:hypothetical protein